MPSEASSARTDFLLALELKDQYGVIKAQVATALPLLALNILIIYLAAFR
jgi:uncharacterized membrane protein